MRPDINKFGQCDMWWVPLTSFFLQGKHDGKSDILFPIQKDSQFRTIVDILEKEENILIWHRYVMIMNINMIMCRYLKSLVIKYSDWLMHSKIQYVSGGFRVTTWSASAQPGPCKILAKSECLTSYCLCIVGYKDDGLPRLLSIGVVYSLRWSGWRISWVDREDWKRQVLADDYSLESRGNLICYIE